MSTKIIPFNKNFHKSTGSNRYELKAQISVYISRNNDRYDIDWSSPDNISYQRIYEILSKIFEDITKEVSTIEYKKEDVYSIEFSLLYYEKDDNTIKYICSTPNISKEKLAEYLWVSLNVYRLKEEGGRHTPFHNHYRPQFYIRTLDVTGEITLPEGVEMVMPGDHVTINVKLITPVACDKGLRFAIREGGRTVGSGQITDILD